MSACRSPQVEMTEEPELGIPPHSSGMHALEVEYEIRDGEVVYGKEDGGVMVTKSAHVGERAHPARSQRGPHRRLRDELRIHSPTWISRFTTPGRPRPAARDRSCWRDAAHVHSPVGGQGLNTVCRMR